MKLITDHHNKQAALKLAIELINKKGQVHNNEDKAELEALFIKRFDSTYEREKKKLITAVESHSASSILSASRRALNKICPYFESKVWVFFKGRKYLIEKEKKDDTEIYDEQKGAISSLAESLAYLLAVGEYVLTSPYGFPVTRSDFAGQNQDLEDAIKTFAEVCLQKDLKLDTAPIKTRFEYIVKELAANLKSFEKQGLIDGPIRYYENQVLAKIKEFADFF